MQPSLFYFHFLILSLCLWCEAIELGVELTPECGEGAVLCKRSPQFRDTSDAEAHLSVLTGHQCWRNRTQNGLASRDVFRQAIWLPCLGGVPLNWAAVCEAAVRRHCGHHFFWAAGNFESEWHSGEGGLG